MSPAKTILITGVAGFIGSNLAHHLLQHTNHYIIGIDKMGVGSNPKNLPKESERFEFTKADICDTMNGIDLILLQEKPDIIVHLAAESHVDRSLEDMNPYYKTNLMGTNTFFQEILDCYRPNRLPLVINQITDEVYGPRVEPAREFDALAPTSPYAASKAAQYYAGKSFMKTYGLPVISTFPCNVFGGRQWPEKLIPKFTLLLLQGKKVPLMKSSQNKREWMCVTDHCRALQVIMEKGIPGWDYNVGPGYRISNLLLTRKLIQLIGADPHHSIEMVPDRLAHDSSYAVDCNFLRAIGFRTTNNNQYSFDSQLEATVRWYKNNARSFYPHLFQEEESGSKEHSCSGSCKCESSKTVEGRTDMDKGQTRGSQRVCISSGKCSYT